MMTPPNDNEFDEMLARLETALERPLIPGELEAWSKDVRQDTEAIDGPLRRKVEGQHANLFGVIEHEDDELLRHVDQMKDDDRNIRKDYDEFVSEVRKLAHEAAADRAGRGRSIRTHRQGQQHGTGAGHSNPHAGTGCPDLAG